MQNRQADGRGDRFFCPVAGLARILQQFGLSLGEGLSHFSRQQFCRYCDKAIDASLHDTGQIPGFHVLRYSCFMVMLARGSRDHSMRRILLAGNWKMHGSTGMVESLLHSLLIASQQESPVDMAVFPPFPYLAQVQAMLKDSNISWGAQNLNPAAQGAYTGDISASMLLDFDCRYVLVGHSERRSLFGESDKDVAMRFEAAHQAGLEPVLCVGETLEEREKGETESVVERQLDAVLQGSGIGAFERAVIAYEPVWAIGTGKTATPEQAQAAHAFIRNKIGSQNVTISDHIHILYGGSVNGSNAADLFAREDIDGGLVGGASLTAEAFLAIRDAAV